MCNGCARTIRKGLLKFDEVYEVQVDLKESSVTISFSGKRFEADKYSERLSQLGYPEKGNNNGMSVVQEDE